MALPAPDRTTQTLTSPQSLEPHARLLPAPCLFWSLVVEPDRPHREVAVVRVEIVDDDVASPARPRAVRRVGYDSLNGYHCDGLIWTHLMTRRVVVTV